VTQRDAEQMDEVSKGLHSEALSLIKDRPAAEAWWNSSTSWWPKWTALCKKAGLGVASDEVAGNPWSYEDATVEKLEHFIKTKNRAGMMDFFRQAVLKARWHRSGAAFAAQVLREFAPGQFPKQAAAFRSFAATLETASTVGGGQPAR